MLVEVAGDVVVSATVFAECTGEQDKPGAQAILRAKEEGLLKVRLDIKGLWPPGMPPMLGAGELSAIALARELGRPVLIDERLGRQVARLHELPVVGSAGILVAAKARGLIPAVAPILAEWKQWGYFLSPGLLASVLTRLGER